MRTMTCICCRDLAVLARRRGRGFDTLLYQGIVYTNGWAGLYESRPWPVGSYKALHKRAKDGICLNAQKHTLSPATIARREGATDWAVYPHQGDKSEMEIWPIANQFLKLPAPEAGAVRIDGAWTI